MEENKIKTEIETNNKVKTIFIAIAPVENLLFLNPKCTGLTILNKVNTSKISFITKLFPLTVRVTKQSVLNHDTNV